MASTSELDPLLPPQHTSQKKPFYRARPLWLVPIALAASFTRGMTLAPRTEVLVQLACENIRNHHHHTSAHTIIDSLFTISNATSTLLETPDYPLLISEMPHLYFNTIHLPQVEDDEPINCATDPDVQSDAAKMSSVMATSLGILSALTTGWWGQLGDRRGRTKVLGAAVTGQLFTDTMFFMASKPPALLKGYAHLLLLLAPIVEGLLGGMSTMHGALYAYLSDCTSHGSRAHIFSRFAGAITIGIAAGPELSALVLRSTQSTTAVFRVSMVFSLLNIIALFFIIPESLSQDARTRNTKAAQDSRAVILQDRAHKTGIMSSLKYVITDFFKPLRILGPVPRENGRGTDWTLPLIAASAFCYQLTVGMSQMRYLYAKHIFEWDGEHLSYYITATGTCRTIYLLLIMPMVIALFKPKPAISPASTSSDVDNAPRQPLKKPPPTPTTLVSEIKFDLIVAKACLILDMLSNMLVTVANTAPLFIGFSLLSAAGGGLVPAVQSIAMCAVHVEQLSQNREAPPTQSTKGGAELGKLFGAFSLLQATGSMIIGPVLYGTAYSMTVATYPQTVFVISACLMFVGEILLFLIRPPRIDVPIEIQVDTQVQVHVERMRGRSRQSKDISQGLR